MLKGNQMHFKAKIIVEYKNEDQARIAVESLRVDNMAYVTSEIDRKMVKYNLSGSSIRSLLATADDLLFCEMVVEEVLKTLK